ncbi:MAG: YbaN family protein [Clostridiales Family XIII bacterium]|nr:YbaN family protein [Clostridiales Family XIII bacterium]
MKRIINPFFIVLGFISLGAGLVGVVLPVIPTTPFLLLTAFCFAKGSKRFHRWFTSTGLYKKHIEGFVEKRAMPARTKASILATVSIVMPIAMYFVPIIHARIAMGIVLIGHWWYFIFRVKTLPAGDEAGLEPGGGANAAADSAVNEAREKGTVDAGAGGDGRTEI